MTQCVHVNIVDRLRNYFLVLPWTCKNSNLIPHGGWLQHLPILGIAIAIQWRGSEALQGGHSTGIYEGHSRGQEDPPRGWTSSQEVELYWREWRQVVPKTYFELWCHPRPRWFCKVFRIKKNGTHSKIHRWTQPLNDQVCNDTHWVRGLMLRALQPPIRGRELGCVCKDKVLWG